MNQPWSLGHYAPPSFFQFAFVPVWHTILLYSRENFMHWIAPSGKNTNNAALEKQLGMPPDICAPIPNSSHSNTPHPSLISSSCGFPKSVSPSAYLKGPSAVPALARAWPNPPPTPRVSFVCPPRIRLQKRRFLPEKI